MQRRLKRMSKPEKAIYNPPIARLKEYSEEYSRVYFGAEFCQWRLPSASSVVKAYEKAAGLGMAFTLLTPWVTDAGLKKLEKIFRGLSEAGAAAEVVINDMGALSLIAGEFPALAPVLGRLLSRQKRCPRVPGIIDGLPEAGREFYLHPGIEDPVASRFLKKMGIKRVELDSPLQGIEADLKAVRLKGSIYTPYAYVTTTRNCPASFEAVEGGGKWQSYTGCRLKGCLKNVIELSSPAHGQPLIMRGNTQFVKSGSLPDGLREMGIDRIVMMEDLP